jgi:hypothetical protein
MERSEDMIRDTRELSESNHNVVEETNKQPEDVREFRDVFLNK